MKKFIVFSLLAIMAFAFVALSPSLAEDNPAANDDGAVMTTTAVNQEQNQIQAKQRLMSSLEKILSPDQIEHFTNIIKEGNSLYGVRKFEDSDSNAKTIKASSTVLTTNGQNLVKQLEKIAAPWLVNQYEQIRKIGTALWGLKKENKEQNRNQEQTRAYVNASSSACVIAAIEVKDTSLKANNEAAAVALNAAITARTACQLAAITATATASSSADMLVNQKTELNLCVKAFNETAAKVKQETATKHQAVWGTYKTGLKACQTTNATASSTEEGLMVEDGGGSIFEN